MTMWIGQLAFSYRPSVTVAFVIAQLAFASEEKCLEWLTGLEGLVYTEAGVGTGGGAAAAAARTMAVPTKTALLDCKSCVTTSFWRGTRDAEESVHIIMILWWEKESPPHWLISSLRVYLEKRRKKKKNSYLETLPEYQSLAYLVQDPSEECWFDNDDDDKMRKCGGR